MHEKSSKYTYLVSITYIDFIYLCRLYVWKEGGLLMSLLSSLCICIFSTAVTIMDHLARRFVSGDALIPDHVWLLYIKCFALFWYPPMLLLKTLYYICSMQKTSAQFIFMKLWRRKKVFRLRIYPKPNPVIKSGRIVFIWWNLIWNEEQDDQRIWFICWIILASHNWNSAFMSIGNPVLDSNIRLWWRFKQNIRNKDGIYSRPSPVTHIHMA